MGSDLIKNSAYHTPEYFFNAGLIFNILKHCFKRELTVFWDSESF